MIIYHHDSEKRYHSYYEVSEVEVYLFNSGIPTAPQPGGRDSDAPAGTLPVLH